MVAVPTRGEPQGSPATRALRAFVLALALLAPAAAAEAEWKRGVAAFKAGLYDLAAPELEEVVVVAPHWHGGHYMLGWTYLEQGRLAEARVFLTRACELAPWFPGARMKLVELELAAGCTAAALARIDEIDPAALPRVQRQRLAELRRRASTEPAARRCRLPRRRTGE